MAEYGGLNKVTQLPDISDSITFQEAIEATQQLLEYIHHPEAEPSGPASSDTAIAQTVASLVQHKQGARGFFVAYLTGDPSPTGPIHPAVIAGLQLAPEQTVELLTKNLAMSTAMALTHSRQDNPEMAQQSSQVRSRTLALMEALQMPSLGEAVSALRDSAATPGGPYEDFLTRWGYDDEQRQRIEAAADEALERLHRSGA